jgi:hypothetical protein
LAINKYCKNLSLAFFVIFLDGEFIWPIRVEYIKQWVPDVKPIILTHVGSNQFVREVYRPDIYSHRITLADAKGRAKKGEEMIEYDVAGPLCFQVNNLTYSL